MLLQTKHFGEIEIDNKEIITFEDGLPGFEDLNKFVLLGQDEESPFGWLQSIDQPDYAFVLVTHSRWSIIILSIWMMT
jgi:flagellar assembly factor FliW